MVKRVYVLLASLCVACGGGSTTPISPTRSTPPSFNGTWTGSNNTFDGAIRFVVQGGVLTSFSITFALPPGAREPCTNTHTVTPSVSIANSTFTFSADVRSGSPPIGFELFTGPVEGTFMTETSGSVTVGRAGSTERTDGGVYAYIYGVQCGFSVTQGLPTGPATIAVNRSGS